VSKSFVRRLANRRTTTLRTLGLGLLCLLATRVSAEPYVAHETVPYQGPVAYVDKKLGIVVYAESDGKHLSAIDFEGRVMWTRSPFSDAHLKPYRVAEPRIVHIYAPLPWMLEGARKKDAFVALEFESTQFGVVDLKSGKFFSLGQD
jgi:hypothetical protein